MRCRIRYRIPVTGNSYYFVDFRSCGDDLKPVGCFSYHYKKYATLFETKRDAKKVLDYLISLGYEARIVV